MSERKGKIVLGSVSTNDNDGMHEVQEGENRWIDEDDFDSYDGYTEDDFGYNPDEWN